MRAISEIIEQLEILKKSGVQISIYANLTGPNWTVIFEAKTGIMGVSTKASHGDTAIITMDKALDNWEQIANRLPEIRPPIEHIPESPPQIPSTRLAERHG